MIPDFGAASWIKSTRSQQTTDQCVELAGVGGYVALRDSKDPDGPWIMFSAHEWQAFTSRIATDE